MEEQKHHFVVDPQGYSAWQPSSPIAGQPPQPSKKAKDRIDKKLKKKIAQAQGVLCRSESLNYDEIIQRNENPSKYLLVAHFGNGDETDQNVLIDFCSKYGGPIENLTIFPGCNYGHVEFKEVESAEKLMNNEEAFESLNCANIIFQESPNPDRLVVFFYTKLKSTDLRKHSTIEIDEAEIAQTGAIPGLYVINDFITEEEEKNMVQLIDQGKWTKLLNRRV